MYAIINIDAVIIAQKPKLAPFIGDMKARVAGALTVDSRQIGIKATTTEGLGFTGKCRGIAAEAVCLIQKNTR